MIITGLEVTNLRAFKHAEFEFTPGMNLLVGVNGVGKTTVLDAIRICLSKTLPEITTSRSRPMPFTDEDIRADAPAMTVQLSFEVGGKGFQFLVHKNRETNVPYKPGEVREQTLGTPNREVLTPEPSDRSRTAEPVSEQPLGVFFSTRRSLVSDAAPSSASAAGGQAAAFADALASRELRLTELASWMRAQEVLADEDPDTLKRVEALRSAAKLFLPDCADLHAETAPKPTLVVAKNGLRLDVRQLSDGECGQLALVLDLARRLSQANPRLSDPVQQGQAVVLIDELDLHLHPRWQRTIVERLTKTFRKCQFIATTHSPQIVAAVEPEQVLLLTDDRVTRPERTLGMDSNWILRRLMEAEDRPPNAAKVLARVEKLIRDGDFEKARTTIASARTAGLDLPEWSVLEARMARVEVLGE